MEESREKVIVFTSGYFDPLHQGHIELFKLAKELGDHLIVAVNNDYQCIQKKGFVFMPHEEKVKIISELRCVDEVIISVDRDHSMIETLKKVKPHIFAKGGDRYVHEIPETPICNELGIKIIDGLGVKVQSSSDLIKNAREAEEKIKEEKN